MKRMRLVAMVVAVLGLGLFGGGCARSKMQASAATLSDAVAQLRDDVEAQQLIRSELARADVEQLARGEAELAALEASRAASRAQLSEAVEPLLRHSQAVSEGGDPRFAPSIAAEVERRATGVEYREQVAELEALSALLERLAEGSRRADILLYLELGASAAQAAKSAWTETEAEQ